MNKKEPISDTQIKREKLVEAINRIEPRFRIAITLNLAGQLCGIQQQRIADYLDAGGTGRRGRWSQSTFAGILRDARHKAGGLSTFESLALCDVRFSQELEALFIQAILDFPKIEEWVSILRSQRMLSSDFGKKFLAEKLSCERGRNGK